MIVMEDNFKTKIDHDTYIALGSFDGVHMGHLSLIQESIRLSKEHGGKSMVFTFKNHPLSVIKPENSPKLLMDNDTKVEVLTKLGLDITNFATFDEELMKLSPEAFIKRLVHCYGMKGVVVGFNYRFGHKNAGDIDLLHELSVRYGFIVSVLNSVSYEGEVVSSSRIRNLILDGDISKANEMLVQPFMLRGIVISGKKLGRKIGFPTANISVPENMILPKLGVYYTMVDYQKSKYKGITNVGLNPTVNDNKLSIETYVLDFHKGIYGESLETYFLRRMRDEERYDSLQELIAQLERDKAFAEKQTLDEEILKK